MYANIIYTYVQTYIGITILSNITNKTKPFIYSPSPLFFKTPQYTYVCHTHIYI